MSMYRSRKRMENVDTQLEQKPSFEVKKTINQTPFKEEAVRSFFYKWCEINDSIVPQIASRQYWKQHVEEQGLLRKNPDGTSTLFIPQDIHLWEMVDVIETIDRDTFANKPELRNKKKQELLGLGKMFRNSGIYIAQRVNSIKEGKPIAQELAQEFFSYGNALITGYMEQGNSKIPIERIALSPISPEETQQIDKWLAGESLYKSRMEHVEKEITTRPPEEADQIIENGRRDTLEQFFRVSEKALLKERKDPQSFHTDKEKPWSTAKPIHSAFLEKIGKKIKKNIEGPYIELDKSILKRGLEKLISEVKEPGWRLTINAFFTHIAIFGGDQNTQQKLIEAIKLEDMKRDLYEARKSGSAKEISKKEIEIAQKIQEAVARFPYQDFANNPSEIIKNKKLNCLGATMLAGALLNEVGINYLQVTIPDHAIILLITTDGKTFWQDIQMPYRNGELHDKDIQGKTKDGQDISINDIVAFSKKPTLEGLLFKLEPNVRRKKMPWSREERQYVYVLPPEAGQQIGLLTNTSWLLWNSGFTKESIEALKLEIEIAPNSPEAHHDLGDRLVQAGRYKEAIDHIKKAIELNPQNDKSYNNLGRALVKLERYEEAIKVYHKSIAINPEYVAAYNALGNIAYYQGKDDDALEMYQRAIEIDPKFCYPHSRLANIFMETERHKEALREYKKFILLADEDIDKDLIAKANEKIKELKKKLSQK